ncbi:MAG: hypothetical protein K0S43_3461, partial [Cellulosimicrobium sp.]|nr:hypothetical protein [Cellulosimicrobium sp.]
VVGVGGGAASTIRRSFLAAPARPATTRHHHPPRPTSSRPGRFPPRATARGVGFGLRRGVIRVAAPPRPERVAGRGAVTRAGGSGASGARDASLSPARPPGTAWSGSCRVDTGAPAPVGHPMVASGRPGRDDRRAVGVGSDAKGRQSGAPRTHGRQTRVTAPQPRAPRPPAPRTHHAGLRPDRGSTSPDRGSTSPDQSSTSAHQGSTSRDRGSTSAGPGSLSAGAGVLRWSRVGARGGVGDRVGGRRRRGSTGASARRRTGARGSPARRRRASPRGYRSWPAR